MRLSLLALVFVAAALALSGSAALIARAQDGQTPLPPQEIPPVLTAAEPLRADRTMAEPAGVLAMADECASATTVTLTAQYNFQFSGSFDTAAATTHSSDPLQSCTWGGAAANSRSVWWRVVVPEDGRLTVSTVSSDENYDTVVTIYPAAGGCGSVGPGAEVGCDDDAVAFHSRATALVDAGESYLVEVTAWGAANPGGKLNLYVRYAPITAWKVDHPSYDMSRHVVVSDGRFLYALGGWRPVPGKDLPYRYDPVSGNWLSLEEMPLLYANTDGAYAGGFIYVPSGFVDNAMPNTPYRGIHYRYSTGTDTWSTGAPITSCAELEEPVAWGAAVADPTGEGYYYTGGRYGTAPSVPLAFILYYDIPSDSWKSLAPMTVARYAHRAAFLGDRLCVVGGVGSEGKPLAAGECYDFASEEWSSISALNLPRYGFGSAVGPDGRWYVFGGSIGGKATTAKTEVYDPAKGVWELKDQGWSLNQSRDWPAGARLGNTIYALGGYLPAAGQSGLVVDTMDRLTVFQRGSHAIYLPALFAGGTGGAEPGDEPNDAIPLAFGPLANGVVHRSDFFQGSDTEDFFYLTTEVTAALQVTLSDIPSGSDYDLFLYGHDPLTGSAKYLFAASIASGSAAEQLQVPNLPAGQYYVRVRNTWNRHSSQPYSLVATH